MTSLLVILAATVITLPISVYLEFNYIQTAFLSSGFAALILIVKDKL